MSISMQVALAVEVDRLRKERDFLGESYDKVCREYVECENLLTEEQQENDRLRAELAEYRRGAERYHTALEQIVAPFEDLNFVSGNKLLTYIHDTATAALAAKEE